MINVISGSSSSSTAKTAAPTKAAPAPSPSTPTSSSSHASGAAQKSAANALDQVWKDIAGPSHSAVSSIVGSIRGLFGSDPTESAATSGKPLYQGDNPDPGVLEVKGKNGQPTEYYETNTATGNNDAGSAGAGTFPIRESTNLKNWKTVGSIFPPGKGPSWALAPGTTNASTPIGKQSSAYWAPEIHQVGTIQSGPNKGKPQYVAYYSARDKDGSLAIGAATSDSPQGPFTDTGKPLVENGKAGQDGALDSNQKPTSSGGKGSNPQGAENVSSSQAAQADGKIGLIDPTFYQDPSTGKNYLIYKVDGNSAGQTTPIMAQELNSQGTGTQGKPVTLLSNTQNWEGPVTEAPEVTKHGKYYYLFYAGNTYDKDGYSVGAARSTSLLGPYMQHSGPVFTSNTNNGAGGGQTAPGHGDVVTGPDNQDYWLYAAYSGAAGQGGRQDYLAPINWGNNPNDWPTFGNNGQPYKNSNN